MRRNKRTLIAAVGVGALVLAGAAAFTNSIGFSNTNLTVGYGAENVSGATVTYMDYGLSTDGTTINSVTFVTLTDTHNSIGSVGFTVAGTPGATTQCAAGVYNASSPGNDPLGNVIPAGTEYVCSGLTQSLAAITATDIVVQ